MAVFPYASQNFSTTLNVGGGITNSQTTGIILTSVTGLDTSGGILCLNWASSLDTAVAEYIEYTGITGNELTGVTRGAEGSSGKAHSNGATVVAVVSKAHINRILDRLKGVDTTQTVLGGLSITTSDPTLASGLNIQVNGADPYRTVSIFGGMKPTTTSPCATKTTVEAGTNDIDYDVLDFDASSDENAFVNFQMPDSYDGGVIQFRYVWTNAGGGAAETVVFELSGRSLANDEAIDQAVGTAVEVSDTWLAQGDVHTSAWSGDVTLGGTPAGGEYIHFEIMRDVSEDTLTGDARLMDVQIRYKQGTYSD